MATNLIKNPELNPAGALPAGAFPGGGSGTIAFAGTGTDTYSRWTLNATGTGFTVGQNLFPDLGVKVGASPGLTYSARVDMRYSRAHTLRLYLQFMQGNWTNLGSTEVNRVGGANTWETFALDGLVAPADTDGIRLLAYCSVSGQVAGDTLDLRRALVTESGTAGDFYSGATTDTGGFAYDWTGTAHQSTSTRTAVTATPDLTMFDGATWRPLGAYQIVTA